MPALHRAIELAVAAHAGQDDPPGEPYILHPMRVMLSLPDADHDVRCVGILHDAVERGTLTLKALRHEKFADAIIRAVEFAQQKPRCAKVVARARIGYSGCGLNVR